MCVFPQHSPLLCASSPGSNTGPCAVRNMPVKALKPGCEYALDSTTSQLRDLDPPSLGLSVTILSNGITTGPTQFDVFLCTKHLERYLLRSNHSINVSPCWSREESSLWNTCIYSKQPLWVKFFGHESVLLCTIKRPPLSVCIKNLAHSHPSPVWWVTFETV